MKPECLPLNLAKLLYWAPAQPDHHIHDGAKLINSTTFAQHLAGNGSVPSVLAHSQGPCNVPLGSVK